MWSKGGGEKRMEKKERGRERDNHEQRGMKEEKQGYEDKEVGEGQGRKEGSYM